MPRARSRSARRSSRTTRSGRWRTGSSRRPRRCSRPNVTADAAGLCGKSGNAVVLRGGSEAIESNTMIAAVLAKAVEKAGGPAEAIQFIDTTDREAVAVLLELDDLVDLIIPRGGEELVRWVAERSRIPVLR